MDLTTFDDAELDELQAALYVERERRRSAGAVDQALSDMVATLVADGTVPGPEVADDSTAIVDVPEWVNPGTRHTSMYQHGAIVAHQGRIWQSEHPGLNHWEPGSAGVDHRIWRDVTPTDAPEQPADPDEPSAPPSWDGQGYAYSVGDLVTYRGDVYEVIQAHTSAGHWTPDAVASLYTRQ